MAQYALIKRFWPVLVGLAILAAVVLAWRYDRAQQYAQGYEQAKIDAAALNVQIERATQQEADRADAQYRGAVLAREAVQKTVATQRARIGGLLDQLRRRTATANAGSGSDGSGDMDWIGLVAACTSEYEFVGGHAARMADKVTGLQNYIKAVRRGSESK